MKNNIYEALIEVTDRGVTFERIEEFFVKKGSTQEEILNVLNKHLKKWRHASDWSTKFTFVVKKLYLVGNC
jgi:chromosome segregation and condensation protein ScpB